MSGRWRSHPILEVWGLIFLKSLVIVFDKSIWGAFRERIRDAPWPAFLPLPPSLFLSSPPSPSSSHGRQTADLITHVSKAGTATFIALLFPPSRPPLRPHRRGLSLSPSGASRSPSSPALLHLTVVPSVAVTTLNMRHDTNRPKLDGSDVVNICETPTPT